MVYIFDYIVCKALATSLARVGLEADSYNAAAETEAHWR